MVTMSTFDESQHPRGQAANAGQFTAKVNDSPTGSLTTHEASAESIMKERRAAASVYLAARNAYFQANRDAAVATLRSRYPGGHLAIFTRNWDEDQVRLHQILGDEDIDFTVDSEWEGLTVEQRDAYRDASTWVREMGEDLSSFVPTSDEEHDGWYEYQLDLTVQPELPDVTQDLLDHLTPADRSRLDSRLSEMDGRMVSTIDTNEIAHQLREGIIGETEPELVEALQSEFGTLDAAAVEIAKTAAWDELRDDVDIHVRSMTFDAIYAGAEQARTQAAR